MGEDEDPNSHRLLLLDQSVGAIYVMTEADQGVLMAPGQCITDPRGRILINPHISLLQCAMEKLSQSVLMDQSQDIGSTPAPRMRRNAPQDKDLDLVTNLGQPALMGLNAAAQGVERTARSASRCAPIARAVLLSAGMEYHTAHGGPRTGTNTMESRPSILGSTDLAIGPKAITGDLNTMEIGHKL